MTVGLVTLGGFSFEALHRCMWDRQETQIDKLGPARQ